MLLNPVVADNNEIILLILFFSLADVQSFGRNMFKILQYYLNIKDYKFDF